MGQLEVVADGRRYLFDVETVVVCGRSVDAHVPLTDRRVGRVHCRLVFTDGDWYLIDANSTNGTWIDRERVDRVRVVGEVTAHLGNPVDGALLFMRPYLPAGLLAMTAPEHVPPPEPDRPEELAMPAPAAEPAPPLAPAAAAPYGWAAETPQPLPLTPAPHAAEPPAPPPIEPPPDPWRPANQAPDPWAAGAAGPAADDPWLPGQPVSAQPMSAQPMSAQPMSAQPMSAQPMSAQPMSGQPPAVLATGQFVVGQPGQPGPGGPALPPGGGVPWGMPGGTITTTNSSQAAPVLVARLGNKTLIYPVGQPVRIGRDPGLEAVTDHPLVSRNYHGLINTDLGGATYTDTSTRGTFHNGKQLRAPLRITEPVTLRLGDPATGEELGITPPLSLERLRANQRRRERGGRLKIGALVAVVVLLLGGGGAYVLLQPKSSNTPSAAGGAISSAVLHHAETATVRLLQGTPDNYTGWGSGTVISADGLILTNAHVAAPDSPGFAVASATPGQALEKSPDFVTVEFTTSDASAAVAKYRAHVVAVDGYLDFAVVKIFAGTDGTPVDPGKLHLPFLPVGDASKLSLDQTITVLGYPGVSGSDSITVTSGIISTFVPDPLRHVNDPRFQLETTARVAHGNSGGAAITSAGDLVGVPSLEIPGEGADLSWRLRSVAPAAPLIAAARAGQDYTSKLLVALSGHERIDSAGIGSTADQACQGGQTDTNTSGPVSIAFNISGAVTGLDVAFGIALPDGTPVTTDTLQGQSVPGLPEAVLTGDSGCLSYTFDANLLGLSALPTGAYHAQMLGGPNLDPLGPVQTFQFGTG